MGGVAARSGRGSALLREARTSGSRAKYGFGQMGFEPQPMLTALKPAYYLDS